MEGLAFGTEGVMIALLICLPVQIVLIYLDKETRENFILGGLIVGSIFGALPLLSGESTGFIYGIMLFLYGGFCCLAYAQARLSNFLKKPFIQSSKTAIKDRHSKSQKVLEVQQLNSSISELSDTGDNEIRRMNWIAGYRTIPLSSFIIIVAIILGLIGSTFVNFLQSDFGQQLASIEAVNGTETDMEGMLLPPLGKMSELGAASGGILALAGGAMLLSAISVSINIYVLLMVCLFIFFTVCHAIFRTIGITHHYAYMGLFAVMAGWITASYNLFSKLSGIPAAIFIVAAATLAGYRFAQAVNRDYTVPLKQGRNVHSVPQSGPGRGERTENRKMSSPGQKAVKNSRVIFGAETDTDGRETKRFDEISEFEETRDHERNYRFGRNVKRSSAEGENGKSAKETGFGRRLR